MPSRTPKIFGPKEEGKASSDILFLGDIMETTNERKERKIFYLKENLLRE